MNQDDHYVCMLIQTRALCYWDGSLQSVCSLNGCCKEKETWYYAKFHKRCSEVVEVKISSAEFFSQFACFLASSFSVISLVCMWEVAINWKGCGQSATHFFHKNKNHKNFF